MDVETDAAAQVLADAGVRVAYLFGSRASDRHRPDSDADIAVLGAASLDLMARERLATRLREALSVPEVDLVVLDEAPLELRGRVVQQGIVLYEADPAQRVAYQVQTLSEYLDYLPTLEKHTRRYLRQVARRGLS
ncbi:MAG: type VII toxin-antitoxin system MntA family adenylyltransferase antitoxin [Acidimicrobiales bacterium]